MVAEGELPTFATISTQTSRPTTAALPPLRTISEEPSGPASENQSDRDKTTKNTLPALTFIDNHPSLNLSARGKGIGELDLLYSERFTELFASARALKREQRRKKLSGSLQDISTIMRNSGSILAIPVAHIKEDSPFSRNHRRYHSIADINNMRNRYTQSRQNTFDRSKSNLEQLPQRGRRPSPVSTASQTGSIGIPPLTGRSTDLDLGGLLRTDSFKTLDSCRSRSLPRSKTTLSNGEGHSAERCAFITNGEGLSPQDTQASTFKLALNTTALQNTPQDSLEVLPQGPLISPGDSDRMKTPDLASYVNGQQLQITPQGSRKNSDVIVGNGVAAQVETNLAKSMQVGKQPVIQNKPKSASKQVPKMVLKYYGNEIAVTNGVIPALLPSNGQIIRGIMLNGHQAKTARLGEDANDSRKVRFKEKRGRRSKDTSRTLAATSIVVSADNMIVPYDKDEQKPVALTTKNLALFDEFQDKKIGVMSTQKRELQMSEDRASGRVLDWVKGNQSTDRKVPQIIPVKHTKIATQEATSNSRQT